MPFGGALSESDFVGWSAVSFLFLMRLMFGSGFVNVVQQVLF